MGDVKVFLVFILCFAMSCNAQNKTSIPDNHADSKVVVKVIQAPDDINLQYLMGQFDPKSHASFIEIPIKYADRSGQYIRKEVFEKLVSMFDAAMNEGVKLVVRSATRNFDDQKRIWENKWTGKTILESNLNAAKDIQDDVLRVKKILEYSSMPGTSRHHWGTDMDFNSFDNTWFESGEGLKLYTWMLNNAHLYGFCQPYSKLGSDRNVGYFEEKWHWTYMPISTTMTQKAKKMITNDLITGFLGSNTAPTVDMVKNYILGISPSCMGAEK